MLGSRSLFLSADFASFVFGYDDSLREHSKEINIVGRTDRTNPPNIANITFTLRAIEVTEDFKYAKIENPHGEHKNEEIYCCGNAILINADEHMKEKTIGMDLLLTSAEFSHLKDILDKLFVGAVELLVTIGIAGKELGFEAWWDEFPPEKNLPVVAYSFCARSKEKANQ
jgi:hypothetical protein